MVLVENREMQTKIARAFSLFSGGGFRCGKALQIGLLASSLTFAAPMAASAGDAILHLASIGDVEFTEVALDDSALSQVRGEGLDAAGPDGPDGDRMAVILWDEERSGGRGSQNSFQIGSLGNTDSASISLSGPQ